MSEPGVEDAICRSRSEGDGLAGESLGQAYVMAENRDEALMLYTADEIPRGVVERFDGFAILALRDAVAIERYAAGKSVVGPLCVVQHNDGTPTGWRNVSFFIRGIHGHVAKSTSMK
jgi:hypothetical protein